MEAISLFDNGARSWIVFGRDAGRNPALIDTNQYLVKHKGKGMLIDPGGNLIFPAMLKAVSKHLSMEDVEAIFASHQDPDVISSLASWAAMNANVHLYLSWVWSSFVAHYGGWEIIREVEDEGQVLPLNGSSDLRLIPAHHCHSPGNFSLYDPTSRILFSGDIGAAITPADQDGLFVADFEAHVPFMETFHRRWMPSNKAKNNWVRRVRELDVEMMCPQHGAIFRGKNVRRFLDWFEALEVGRGA